MLRLVPAWIVLLAAGPALAGSNGSIAAAVDAYAAALVTGDAAAIAGAFAEDGELLLPGQPAVHGRAALITFLAPLTAAARVESVTMTIERQQLHGTVAEVWGRYRQRAGPPGGAAKAYGGRYVGDWARIDGQWRIVRLLMQPD